MADPAWNVINESATGFHIFRIEVMYIEYQKNETALLGS